MSHPLRGGDVELRAIDHVLPLPPGLSDDEAEERGWWPVLGFTEDVRPIVFEINLN
jgi:hypothetical protein